MGKKKIFTLLGQLIKTKATKLEPNIMSMILKAYL